MIYALLFRRVLPFCSRGIFLCCDLTTTNYLEVSFYVIGVFFEKKSDYVLYICNFSYGLIRLLTCLTI